MTNQQKELFRTSIFVGIGLIFSKFLAYIYRMIIARHFGAEAYGRFSIATMVLGWMVLLATLGVTQGILRYTAIYRGKDDSESIKYIRSVSVTMLTLAGVVSGLLLYIFSGLIANSIFHDPSLVLMLKILSIAVPFSVLLNLFLAIIQAYEKTSWFSFIFNVVQNTAKLGAIAGLIWIASSVSEAVSISASYVFGVAVSLIVSYFVCKKYFPEIFHRHSLTSDNKKEVFKSLILYSMPTMLFGLIYSVLYWTDTFILGIFKTAVDVGIYNSATLLSMSIVAVSDIFLPRLFPMMTKEYALGNLGEVKKLRNSVIKWICCINVPILLGALLFPEFALKLLFGAEYIPAAMALRLLTIGAFMTSIGAVYSAIISMAGKPKWILYDVIGISVLNMIMNVAFVQWWGIVGSALATGISLTLLSVIFLYQANCLLKVKEVK